MISEGDHSYSIIFSKPTDMRFKNTNGTYKIYAVTGTNTIAFGIDCNEADMQKLLGFTIEKEYTKK